MLQTPFVRQNTPHPKELKAKAHKLFAKGQSSLEDSNEQSSEPVVEAVNQVLATPEREHNNDDAFDAAPVGNGAEESSEPSADDDTDDVS